MITISRLLRLALSLTMLHFTPAADAKGRPEAEGRDQDMLRLAVETTEGADWLAKILATIGAACLLAAVQPN